MHARGIGSTLLALGLLVSCGEAPTTPPAEAAATDAARVQGLPQVQEAPRKPRHGPWPLSFLARRELRVPGKPVCVWAGDLDGDGRDELAAALQEPGRLLVWRGSAGSLESEPCSIEAGGWPVGLVASPDPLDPARRLLVLVARQPPKLQAYALTATGELVLRCEREFDSAPVAFAGMRGGSAVVCTRDARIVCAPLDPKLPPHAFGLGPEHACAALVTSAGDLHIGFQAARAVSRLEAVLRWWEPGMRIEPPALHALGAIPRAFAELDLDGDARTEVVACGGDRALWLLDGGPPRAWSAGGLVPLALAAADLDGDQRAELVSIASGDTAFGVQAQFGANGATLTLSEYAGQTPVALALGRFDADARIDLAIANRDALAISVLSGTGIVKEKKNAFYQATRVAVGRNPVALASGNFHGDGASEVLTLNSGSGDLSLLDNEFGLLRARAPLAAGPSPRGLVAADVDGDGATDAAWLVDDARVAKLCLARGDGKGGLLAPQTLEVGRSATALLAGEWNGAPGLQLIALDRDGNRVRRFAWDRAARALRSSDEVECPLPRAAVLAAWKGDGRADVLIASDADLTDTPFRSLVGPTTAPLRGVLPAGFRAQTLCAADCDGDGRPDVVVLASNGQANAAGRLALVLNRASGEKLADVVETGLLPARAWAGDLDGDGLADVAVAAQNSHLVQVWLARKAGDGVKLVRQSDLGAGLGPLDVLGVDLNQDGVIDLAVANNFSDDVSVLYDVPPK
ncbi:MAG: VCBS repeat-containing protein [Planctomycetes bacterium]|nr:VCBS repeat-containing protein [Planctomycetota bacterium]